MAHTHPVIDGDNHFIIDAITRAVTNAESKKTILMQNDHNSEQFTFEINKLVEGHDMTLCNKVEVHYINEDSNKKNKNVGVYEVTDMRESEEDPDRLIFSWLVSENATLYAGSLRFLIVFSCIEKGDVTYRWNTNVNASISIAKGMNNGEAIEEAYPDILTKWKSELFTAMYGMETTYVGPHEPETYPYIWFDTSEYLDQTDPYVGVIKVKDAEGRLWPIYPFTKLVATDGVGLDVVLENILKSITELEDTKLEEEDVAELIKDKVTADDVNEMIKDKVDAEDVSEMIKDKVDTDDLDQALNEKLQDFNPESLLPEGILVADNIANNLTTSDEGYVLDARQGKALAEMIGQKAVTFTINSFLVHNGWSSTAPYTQTVNVNGILASDTPLAYPYKPDEFTDDNMRACLESWDCVDRIVAGDGTITAYGYDEKPPDNIAFMIKIVR